ncbi:MAG: DUF5058 family protein [Clostridiales bacterium]|nr:DUF5058 family protein [Clostridiales bacterium]MDD2571812.1 DUF5058 family protein [Eubacteriales bacterium]
MFHVNHPMLFGLAALVILFVLGQSIFFTVKAWKRARELGMSKSLLASIVRGSAVFSIAPAIAIIIGIITLSKFLGLPLPWLRLSVVGALTYELPAATSAATALGISLTDALTDARAYSTIAWVMTIGSFSGLAIITLFLPKIEKGLMSLKSKDEKWGKIFMDSLFIGMVSAFLGMIFSEIRLGLPGWIPVFVMAFSSLLMLVFGYLVKKKNIVWLENYAMPFSMLGAMIFSIPLTAWIGGSR